MSSPKLLALLCLLLFISTPSVESSIVDVNRYRNGQIESGFALMEVKDVGEEKAAMELCVNFQQFEKRPFPEESFHLVWWNSSPGLTTICHPPTKPHQFDGNELLPLDYITNGDELGELCRQNNPDWALKMGGSVEFQVSNAENAGIKTILFLVPRNGVDEKEGNNSTNLHSKFCNAEINGRAQDNGSNIFYIYDDVFDQQVVPKLRASQDRLELRFRRPSHGLDLGLPLLWLLCLIAVALGSIWSAKAATARLERKSTKRQQQQISGDRGTEPAEMEAANKEAKKKPFTFTTLIWAIMIVVLICVIYAAFWLATNAQQVLVASLLWTAFGIFCMAKCLFALCKYVLCPKRYGQQKPFFQYQRIRLTGLGLLCYLLSAAICLPWPFLRPKPWAFVLLDLMSVCMVAYLIKYLSYESLKKKQIWSPRARLIFTTILFIIAILWLIFLQSAKSNCEPKAPIVSLSQTETFGSLIMPMLSDPLAACWDTQIETGFHFISIPFVSIVISAAVSVPMWFHVDFVNGRRFPYGFAALFGYSLGLLFVLFFMMYFNSVHWLLAYLLLMPWSIYAVLILALIKGTHKQLLKGEMISADHQIN